MSSNEEMWDGIIEHQEMWDGILEYTDPYLKKSSNNFRETISEMFDDHGIRFSPTNDEGSVLFALIRHVYTHVPESIKEDIKWTFIDVLKQESEYDKLIEYQKTHCRRSLSF